MTWEWCCANLGWKAWDNPKLFNPAWENVPWQDVLIHSALKCLYLRRENSQGKPVVLAFERGVRVHWECYSNILTWRIQWTEEPGGLQSLQWQRVRHNWVADTFTLVYWDMLSQADRAVRWQTAPRSPLPPLTSISGSGPKRDPSRVRTGPAAFPVQAVGRRSYSQSLLCPHHAVNQCWMLQHLGVSFSHQLAHHCCPWWTRGLQNHWIHVPEAPGA